MKKKDLTLILIPVGLLVGYYVLKSSKIIPTAPSQTAPETIRSNALSALVGNLITPVTGVISGVLSGITSLFAKTPAVVVPNYLQTQSQDIGGFFAPSDFGATYVPDIFAGAIDYSDASYGWGGVMQNF